MNVTVSVDLYMYNKIFFKKNKLKTQTLKFYCLNYTMKCLKGHAAFLQFFTSMPNLSNFISQTHGYLKNYP